MQEIKTNLEVKEMSLDSIQPYKKNPRNNAAAVPAVAESIRRFGFKVPLVIDSSGEIVTGHTRYQAAKDLGLEKVPVIIADDLTPDQIRAFRLADNKVAELATWDDELLIEELLLLPDDESMAELGFEDVELDLEQEDLSDDADQEAEDDDYEVPPDLQADRVQTGDIWQLGEHRLMCGDSLSEADVSALMDGKMADLVFTDPPYGMKKENRGVLGDNQNRDDLLDFNRKWIPISFDHLKESGSWYCFGIDEPLMDIYVEILKPMIRADQLTFRNLITWDKGSAQGQRSEGTRMYAHADEKCLFVMTGVQGFNTNSDNYFENWEPIRLYLAGEMEKLTAATGKTAKQILGNQMAPHYFSKSQWLFPTRENYEKLQAAGRTADAFRREYDAFRREYDEIRREYDEIRREYYSTRAYFDNTHDNMNSVWHFNPVTGGTEEYKDAGGHATPKPIALCARAIKSSSRPSEVVLDLFGGSGSTLIASEQLGRKCYMMELAPKWCALILDRWERLTGQKAKKVK